VGGSVTTCCSQKAYLCINLQGFYRRHMTK